MCRAMSVSSRVCEGCKLIIWSVIFPRWVEMIIYMEYREVIKILRPMRMIDEFAQENMDVVIISSPIRLIDGGMARLARLARIHHVAIRGNNVWRPRAMIIVRLWMRS